MKKIISMLLLSNSCYAGIESEMTKFFDSLGYSSNITPANAYHEQQGGYYTAGSMVARAKRSQENLFGFMPPNSASQCGKFDFYGGSFSFISAEQFLSLLTNIGQNALGYGISIALQTAAPQMKSTLDQLMATLQDVNNMMLDSCNASATLLGGILPRTEASSQVLCQEVGHANNRFEDLAHSRQQCGKGNKADEVIAGKNQDHADLLGNEFNLAWKALNKEVMFRNDRTLAEIFMSISGSVIMQKNGEKRYPVFLDSLAIKNNLIAALIEGGEAMVYKCDKVGVDECIHPVEIKTMIRPEDSFLAKIDNFIQSLQNKIKSDGEISEAEKSFVNLSNFPILKILAVETAFKSGNSPLAAHEVSHAIAFDIVLRYLEDTLALTNYAVKKLQAVQFDELPFKEFNREIRQVRNQIYQKRQGLYQQLNTTLAFVERTSQIEKQLHALIGSGDLL